MPKKVVKKKNTQDITVNNLRASKKRELSLKARVERLEKQVKGIIASLPIPF